MGQVNVNKFGDLDGSANDFIVHSHSHEDDKDGVLDTRLHFMIWQISN